MRDPKRIQSFCDEIAQIWETYVPDWRFGQLIENVLGPEQAVGRDPWFMEEREIVECFRKHFGESE